MKTLAIEIICGARVPLALRVTGLGEQVKPGPGTASPAELLAK